MSANDRDELRDEEVGDERPETKDAAEEFLSELQRRGIIDDED